MDRLDSEILEEIFNELQVKLNELCSDVTCSSFYILLECISLVCTYLEVYKIQEKTLTGYKKKNICKEFLTRKLLGLIDEERYEEMQNIIIYSSDHVIESLIYFAKNNKIIKKSKKCAKYVSCM